MSVPPMTGAFCPGMRARLPCPRISTTDDGHILRWNANAGVTPFALFLWGRGVKVEAHSPIVVAAAVVVHSPNVVVRRIVQVLPIDPVLNGACRRESMRLAHDLDDRRRESAVRLQQSGDFPIETPPPTPDVVTPRGGL
jgi:hypothetical protein